MTRVASESFPAVDEPVDAAVPASSLLTLPGEAARGLSRAISAAEMISFGDRDGSPNEILSAAEIALQVQTSMADAPPVSTVACSSQLRVDGYDGGVGRALILSSGADCIFTQEDKADGVGAEGKIGGGEAGLVRGTAMGGSAAEGGEEVCHMQHPGS